MTDHDELDPTLREALDALPREEAPPAGLEERTVRALRTAGLLPHASTRLRWAAPRIAAALLLFLGGVAAGRASIGEPPQADGQRYVLLLYRGAEGGDRADRVQQYREWGRALRREGRLETGEKLAPDLRVLSGTGAAPAAADSPTDPPLTGFFVIVARDDEEAERIARTCPHLKYGDVVVKRIEPT
jgi:hypothetical protein